MPSKKIKLDDLKGKPEFFQAPQGYFEKMTAQLNERTRHKPQQPSYARWMRKTLLKRLALPVSAAVLGICFWLFTPFTKPSETIPQTEISETQIHSYLITNGLSEDEVVSVLVTEEGTNELTEEVIDFTEEITPEELELITEDWNTEG
jgi:hypothetical protein